MKVFSSKRFMIFHAALALVVLAIALFVTAAPFGNDALESVVYWVGMLCWPVLTVYLIVVILAYFVGREGRQRVAQAYRMPGFYVFVVPLILGLAVHLSWVMRSQRADDLRWDCNGTVARLYNSWNHQAESVEILNASGTTVVYESVYHPTYSLLKRGVTVLKNKWSPYAMVNGQEVQWVQPDWLDRVRGIKEHQQP